MKLCFASHRYAPLIGGYDNQIKLLAEHLSKHFPVKVVTFNLTNSQNHEVINNVEVYRVKPQLVFFFFSLSLAYLNKIGKMDFDILHAHGFVPIVSDLSLTYAKMNGKSTVYTHHFDGNVQDAKTWNSLADVYNRTVARQSFRFADAVVATTKSYAQTSPALKPYLNNIHVIPCFVDCNQFKPAPPATVTQLRTQLGLGDRKTVLFVGRIVPYKGVKYLIKAVEYAKTELGEDLDLLLLGGGEGKAITDTSAYYQQITQLAKASLIAENIRFLGRIKNEDLSAYYSLADVLALPSVMRGEAFGAVLLEALACGTPIVASDIPGVRDVLKNNSTLGFYVPPRDVHALSKALINVANRKQSVTGQCRQFAQENYDVQVVAQDYLTLYSSISK